jgi:hypothetical protein
MSCTKDISESALLDMGVWNLRLFTIRDGLQGEL